FGLPFSLRSALIAVMTIIVFLVDTSGSMNHRTHFGARPTLLDVAKDAVEKFLKSPFIVCYGVNTAVSYAYNVTFVWEVVVRRDMCVCVVLAFSNINMSFACLSHKQFRQRDIASRGDRYMLLTFEESPNNVKAGWKESHVVFMNELKNLTATGMTTMGPALKNAFDLLNINRMQTGIDTYGQGRCPFFLEPSIIIVITDGGRLCTNSGVSDDLNLPMHSSVPGSELTKEPFRWDQRLFSIVLRLTGTYNSPTDSANSLNTNFAVPTDESPIDAMCDVTGGTYCRGDHRLTAHMTVQSAVDCDLTTHLKLGRPDLSVPYELIGVNICVFFLICDPLLGRSYCVTSQRTLMASIDQLIQRIHGGVVINFEKVGPDPPVIIPNDEEVSVVVSNTCDTLNGLNSSTNSNNNNVNNNLNKTAMNLSVNNNNNTNNNTNNLSNDTMGGKSWHSTRKLIYVQRSAQKGYSVGHWPIPESFWPDVNCPTLQPRTAHPLVKFTCADSEPTVIENLPFDKYELEPSPLTAHILSRKQPHVAWQVFVANSHKSTELGLPFGYLKASTNLTCVNLFVLPYNYPILLPLLEDLFKLHQGKPTREWKVQFDNYLKLMPLYYASPLKRALQRMGAPNLVPDNMENCLSYPVLNYLKRLKNLAKAEYEKLVATVGTGAKPGGPLEGSRVVSNGPNMRKMSELGLCSNPLLSKRFAGLKNELNEFPGFVIRFRDKYGSDSKTHCYRNAFDINRSELLDQIFRMRTNFMQRHTNAIRYQDDDQLHSLPISQMGNYQEYLKRMPVPLRELESTPVRQHMFGNPFKVDKRGMMMIDETDIDLVGSGGGNGGSSPMRAGKRSPADIYLNGPKPKRKPGPLPKDFPLRPLSPIPSPPPSPTAFSALPTPPVSPIPVAPPVSPIAVALPVSPIPVVAPPVSPIPVVAPPLSPIPVPPSVSSIPVVPPVSPLPASSPQTTLKTVANGRVITNHSEHNGTHNGLKDAKKVQFTPEEFELKRYLFKLVRRPGRNFDELLRELSTMRAALRDQLLQEVIAEANRFKRKSLIELLCANNKL
ncbi:unnamed protein product, partial [Oppiella nova]